MMWKYIPLPESEGAGFEKHAVISHCERYTISGTDLKPPYMVWLGDTRKGKPHLLLAAHIPTREAAKAVAENHAKGRVAA